jgi:hypothetical protein
MHTSVESDLRRRPVSQTNADVSQLRDSNVVRLKGALENNCECQADRSRDEKMCYFRPIRHE